MVQASFPKLEDDMYFFEEEDVRLGLIPTGEVSLVNMYAQKTLEKLPIKLLTHSPCFRKEAGSYGKDTKGLIRMHQFDKVELVQLVALEDSYDALEALCLDSERILQALKLPYRKMLLCAGDMSFTSAKTYDLEVWLPGQQMYREVASISNCEAFQAARLGIKYKDAQGARQTVHTLNGTGGAVGRCLVAVIENYQNKDGSITVPEVLQPYMGIDLIAHEVS